VEWGQHIVPSVPNSHPKQTKPQGLKALGGGTTGVRVSSTVGLGWGGRSDKRVRKGENGKALANTLRNGKTLAGPTDAKTRIGDSIGFGFPTCVTEILELSGGGQARGGGPLCSYGANNTLQPARGGDDGKGAYGGFMAL